MLEGVECVRNMILLSQVQGEPSASRARPLFVLWNTVRCFVYRSVGDKVYACVQCVWSVLFVAAVCDGMLLRS